MRISRLLFLLLPLAALAPLRADEGYKPAVQVQTLLKTTTDAAGQPLHYPACDPAEVSCVMVTLPAGSETGWHSHPNPCFAYVVEGEIRVDYENGGSRSFKAGEALAEVVGLRHNGVVLGDKPVRMVMFMAGGNGKPISVRDAARP